MTPTSLHLLSMTHGLGCIAPAQPGDHVAVSPDGRWFCRATSTASACFTVVLHQLTMPLGQGVKISPPIALTVPTQAGDALVDLVALDRRHGALVVRRGDRTLFHGFTRRGTAMGRLTASVPLYNLVATHRPHRYLALEEGCPNAVLVIDLMPFRMLRHRADIAPRWLFETAVGYGLLSTEGEFSLINEEGRLLNRMAGLPRPQAMVPLGAKAGPEGRPTQYVWSVSENDTSRIYTVDLAHLAPDILF